MRRSSSHERSDCLPRLVKNWLHQLMLHLIQIVNVSNLKTASSALGKFWKTRTPADYKWSRATPNWPCFAFGGCVPQRSVRWMSDRTFKSLNLFDGRRGNIISHKPEKGVDTPKDQSVIDKVSLLPPIGKSRRLSYNYGSCHWSEWEIIEGSDMSVTTVTIWQLVNEKNETRSLKEWEIIFQRIRYFPNDPCAQWSLCLFAKLSSSPLSLSRRIIILCEPAVSKMPGKNYKNNVYCVNSQCSPGESSQGECGM